MRFKLNASLLAQQCWSIFNENSEYAKFVKSKFGRRQNEFDYSEKNKLEKTMKWQLSWPLNLISIEKDVWRSTNKIASIWH